jgi:Spherulation-specific family 4
MFAKRPAIVLLVVVLIALGTATAVTKLLAHASPAPQTASPSPPVASGMPSSCLDLVVPAYFDDMGDWARASRTRPAPANLILDLPNGVGAGPAPDPSFQAVVRQAESAGVTILGYSSTVDGARPAPDVEADARHYRDWYGVTHVFLDRVTGQAAQFGYYQRLSAYIHQLDGPASVWMNPGDYPDQDYMSIGDVVMVFEGTYAQYLPLRVPSWVDSYTPSRFAHTIYATPGPALANALGLARDRRATHVYATDLAGANPYRALPGYWSRESAYGCG